MTKFLGCIVTIAILFFIFNFAFERLRFSAIVIHHSASGTDNYQSIAAYHKNERGWRDAAYHLILSNGSTEVPLGFLEVTSRYRSLSHSVATKSVYHNLWAIHICVVGNYDKQEMPDRLKAALADAVRQLQEKYSIADNRILFHRDCSSSSCPGRFVTKEKLNQWLTAETSRCPSAIKIQHRLIIGNDWKLFSLPARAVTGISQRALELMKDLQLFGPPPFKSLKA